MRFFVFNGPPFYIAMLNQKTGWYYAQSLNNCYKVITETGGITQQQGDALCKSSSGQLASIHSAEENRIVSELSSIGQVQTNYQTLTGGIRTGVNPITYGWSDGTPFDYQNWATTQPDNRNNAQACLQIWASNNTNLDFRSFIQKWDDAECGAKFLNVICKITLGGGGKTTPSNGKHCGGRTTAKPLSNCPSDWIYLQETGNCYRAVTQAGGVDYEQADALCKSNGGQLVSIHSDKENELVYELSTMGQVNTLYHTLIGGVKIGAGQNDFGWSDGSPFDYQNWAPTPDAKSCIQMWSSNYTGLAGFDFNPYITKWDDASCNAKYLNAVCKLVSKKSSTTLKTPSCPSDWHYEAGLKNCYKVITKSGGINFDQANIDCKALGGELASIHSAEENQLINSLTTTGKNLTAGAMTLIGGQRTGPNPGDWRWVDNSAWDYTSWISIGPNNYAGVQNCIQVLSSNIVNPPAWYEVGNWDDLECSYLYLNAVCKRIAF
ncbi:unnamed protein product, partial [Mesorhabditis belari]|uniref:C-type lectin domain-containing protein n=1 Tax=Mesorhabditis belari TaxID=2138241 RepID=A0AAF3ECD4_9BILA